MGDDGGFDLGGDDSGGGADFSGDASGGYTQADADADMQVAGETAAREDLENYAEPSADGSYTDAQVEALQGQVDRYGEILDQGGSTDELRGGLAPGELLDAWDRQDQ